MSKIKTRNLIKIFTPIAFKHYIHIHICICHIIYRRSMYVYVCAGICMWHQVVACNAYKCDDGESARIIINACNNTCGILMIGRCSVKQKYYYQQRPTHTHTKKRVFPPQRSAHILLPKSMPRQGREWWFVYLRSPRVT